MIRSLAAGLVLLSSYFTDTSASELRLVSFDEPGFPAIGVATPAILPPNATIAHDGAELDRALNDADVLVWRHGSAYPAECWPAIVKFLERGGSWLHLGGEPFTQPIGGTPGNRQLLGRTLAPLRELRLLRPSTLDASGTNLAFLPLLDSRIAPVTLAANSRVTILQPRFCDSSEFPNEEGSPGARDAILRPLAYLSRDGDLPNHPFAAAAYAIDRIRGRFAGGRWVLHLVDRAPTPDAFQRLLDEVTVPPIEVLANPIVATLHDQEIPRIRLRITQPRPASSADATDLVVRVLREGKTEMSKQTVRLAPGTSDTTFELERVTTPGLYRVVIAGLPGGVIETGFFKSTTELLASGKRLTTDGSHLARGRDPLAAIGTTMMSPDVHRAFLFEPNPALWDDCFAQLAALDFDIVRTGLWYGWSRVIDDAGNVDENFLRALEAYYLCAQRHDIALVFNVFAFLPPQFGGTHPYLDERAVAQQVKLVSALAKHFSKANGIAFDFINEPSFAPPKLTWYTRPSGESVDRDAFLKWLENEYGATPVDWREVVRTRWNLAPGEAIDLPSLRDFEEAQVFADRRPLRALDYLRFAQHAFNAWSSTLAGAVRATDSRALLTVGQDEGGLLERPNPLLHGPLLSFTSIHTWWWNDALLFDTVASKARGLPLLVSETGIQPRERRDGNSQRDGATAANLLVRKLAAAYAGRACGAIQWCFHTNPYLASDAEAGIGLLRVDGSATPELGVLQRFAKFAKRNASKLAPLDDPGIDIVLPNSDLAGPRALPKDGVSRAIERLTFGLGLSVQAVAEWNPSALQADVIVLPAARQYGAKLLAAVRARLAAGATVITTGIPRTEDGALAFPELASSSRPLGRREAITLGGREHVLEFPLVAYESLDASAGGDLTRVKIGSGELVNCPLPLEYALDGAAALDAFYSEAVIGSAHAPEQLGIPPRSPVSVAYVSIDRGKRVLAVAINETQREQTVSIALAKHPERAVELHVAGGAARLLLLDRDGDTIDVLDER